VQKETEPGFTFGSSMEPLSLVGAA